MIAVEIACNLPETKRDLYAIYLKMCQMLLDRLGGAIDHQWQKITVVNHDAPSRRSIMLRTFFYIIYKVRIDR